MTALTFLAECGQTEIQRIHEIQMLLSVFLGSLTSMAPTGHLSGAKTAFDAVLSGLWDNTGNTIFFIMDDHPDRRLYHIAQNKFFHGFFLQTL